jgi:hypothetical protein
MRLSDAMDFDRVIRIDGAGRIEDVPGVWAPNLFDGELDDPAWEFASTGYTGQYGYNGPVMHDSESIGGRLELDILAHPGVYAAVAAYYEDEDGETVVEGWAIVRLRSETNGTD